MRSMKLLVIGAILMVAIVSWGNQAAPKANEGKRWEHKIAYTASEDELNRLGAQGWELAAAYSTASTPYCVFKRVK